MSNLAQEALRGNCYWVYRSLKQLPRGHSSLVVQGAVFSSSARDTLAFLAYPIELISVRLAMYTKDFANSALGISLFCYCNLSSSTAVLRPRCRLNTNINIHHRRALSLE